MKILFAGDVMLGRLVNQVLEDKSPAFPWGDTLGIFKEADLRVCNLECVISDRGVPWAFTPKAFHFRTGSKNVKCLKAAGIDIVSLANNHILDFEHKALLDTLEILDKEGISRAGAGKDIEEAGKPAFITKDGLTIGFVSFTDNEPDWEATDKTPGTFYVPINRKDRRALLLFNIIKKAKEKAGLVIASAHWGPNWGYKPAPAHIPFGHELIDSGADIVFGHSCHVFQGIEIYKGRPIIYSAGNFIDDYAVDEIERNDESFIFMVKARDGRITGLDLYPTVIDEFKANLAFTPRAELIAAKMKNLCLGFNTHALWNEDKGRLEIRID